MLRFDTPMHFVLNIKNLRVNEYGTQPASKSQTIFKTEV
jgi:hypothetical protein